MIRVVLPFHLRTLAHVDGDVMLEVEGQATQRSVLDALEARYPMLSRNDPRPRARRSADRFCGFSPASKICRTTRLMLRCPKPSPRERSPFWSWGPSLGAKGWSFSLLPPRSHGERLHQKPAPIRGFENRRPAEILCPHRRPRPAPTEHLAGG